MECRDRYFMIAVDLSIAGNEPHFEAVGKSCTAASQTGTPDHLIHKVWAGNEAHSLTDVGTCWV